MVAMFVLTAPTAALSTADEPDAPSHEFADRAGQKAQPTPDAAPEAATREAADSTGDSSAPLDPRYPVELFVRVLRADDSPMGTVSTKATPVGGDIDDAFDSVRAVSGSDGVARLQLAANCLYDVVAIQTKLRVQTPASGRMEVEMRPAPPKFRHYSVADPADRLAPVRVEGVVLMPDGQPAAGAMVWAASVDEGRGLTSAIALAPAIACDEKGRFVLDCIKAAVLQARLTGFAPSDCWAVEKQSQCQLRLHASRGSLHGVVVDANDKPLAGAWAQLSARQHWLGQSWPWRSFRSDASGSFCVHDLPANRYELRIGADGHAPVALELPYDANLAEPLRVVLPRGVNIRGLVRDQHGVPCADAEVQLDGAENRHRRTGGDGTFCFLGVAAAAQTVRVSGKDFVAQTFERDVATVADPWIVQVVRRANHRFQLLDQRGNPCADWLIQLGGDEERLSTDAAGLFTVLAAPEEGHNFRLRRNRRSDWLSAPWPPDASAHGTTTLVVPLPQAASVRAHLVDALGATPTYSWVAFLDRSGTVTQCLELYDGRLHTEVPVASTALTVSGCGMLAVSVQFALPPLRVGSTVDLGTLRLPPLGSLRLIDENEGHPHCINDLFTLIGDDGREQLVRHIEEEPILCPVGRWRWRLRREGGAYQRGEFDVTAGAMTTIRLGVRPAVPCKLRFPLPTPPWGDPQRVQFMLRGPDGAVYDDGAFDPRIERPYRYWPSLTPGRWTLELTTDAGLRYRGEFQVDSLVPLLDEVVVSVQPAR